MNLSQLLENCPKSLAHIWIENVTSDSREVKPGALYVAIEGISRDGHRYVADAIKSGAAAVIGTKPIETSVPYIQVSSSRQTLAKIASRFFGEPTKTMKVIGVTGTSGKTTLTYLLESVFSEARFDVGVIGTVNFRLGDKKWESTHTTPDPVGLQKMISEMKSAGCNCLVMEVSSHALTQHRVDNVFFDAVAFTNLSQDHLDYHDTMESYFESKKLLFTERFDESKNSGKTPIAVINVEDEFGKRLCEEARAEIGNGLVESSVPNDWKIDPSGIHGNIEGEVFDADLIGYFNAENLALASQIALHLGLDRKQISKGIAKLKGVPGRLEKVWEGSPLVLVDYAHKPAALEKVLETLRATKNPDARIITVVGCGGDRDREKRPVMGRIATGGSDWVVFTNDNPRTEDPEKILDAIAEGAKGRSNFEIIEDREAAIRSAIDRASPKDIVLIAGKGHENYQIVADSSSPSGTKKIPFDDRQVALKLLTR